jgi:hypothetical protein
MEVATVAVTVAATVTAVPHLLEAVVEPEAEGCHARGRVRGGGQKERGGKQTEGTRGVDAPASASASVSVSAAAAASSPYTRV